MRRSKEVRNFDLQLCFTDKTKLALSDPQPFFSAAAEWKLFSTYWIFRYRSRRWIRSSILAIESRPQRNTRGCAWHLLLLIILSIHNVSSPCSHDMYMCQLYIMIQPGRTVTLIPSSDDAGCWGLAYKVNTIRVIRIYRKRQSQLKKMTASGTGGASENYYRISRPQGKGRIHCEYWWSRDSLEYVSPTSQMLNIGTQNNKSGFNVIIQ